MKARNVENRLAILGAVITLVGVSAAASTALADEAKATLSDANSVVLASAERGKEPNRAAADDAVKRIAEDVELDLEIHFKGRTSKQSARL
ncbi:MAG: hypothetical protein KJO82_02980 [Gammaproteobacteria bacterium]|nr:hypothetical protein [Gammaproteobacteria bacterium]